MTSLGFPEFQWYKGHGLPRSGTGHNGLIEKDTCQDPVWLICQRCRDLIPIVLFQLALAT